MLPPAGHIHDRGDRCSLGLLEQAEHHLLFSPAAGRTRGNASKLCRLLRALGRRELRLARCVAVRHLEILSVATAQAPSPPKPHSGGIASGAGSSQGPTGPHCTTTLTLRLQPKSSPLCG